MYIIIIYLNFTSKNFSGYKLNDDNGMQQSSLWGANVKTTI